jgi:hypothetical protein
MSNPFPPYSNQREALCASMATLRTRLYELPPVEDLLPVEEVSGLEWLLHGLQEEQDPAQQCRFLLDIAATAVRLHMHLSAPEAPHAD